MGFHLRKSFKIGAMRFNLSNSGIGFSTGIKGLRVGIDGKGRSYIGGGKGALRFRQQISGAANNDKITGMNIDKSELPDELKNVMVNGFDILLVLFTIPLSLLFCIMLLYFIFSAERSMAGVIFSLAFLIPILFSFKKFKSEKNILLKKVLANLKNNDFSNALNSLTALNECKFKNNEAKHWISDRIYDCYEALNDYESAYNFMQNDFFCTGHREKIVKCLYKLEKWEKLINYLQTSYNEQEKEEHPVYYAMLADAFKKQGEIDIALETLLRGPVNKRTMNAEMCAFRYALGECYEAAGDRQNALKQYQKVYSFDVNYEDIKNKINI